MTDDPGPGWKKNNLISFPIAYPKYRSLSAHEQHFRRKLFANVKIAQQQVKVAAIRNTRGDLRRKKTEKHTAAERALWMREKIFGGDGCGEALVDKYGLPKYVEGKETAANTFFYLKPEF